MMCPTDGNVLVMSERNGIEIDYCPECRGVWLDRGELDKILERAQTGVAAPTEDYRPEPGSYEYERDQRQQRYNRAQADVQPGYGQSYGGHDKRKRKKNWLEEIFD